MKSVFKEVEVFVASDGTEFFDEDYCKDYEDKIDYDKKLNKSGYFIYGCLRGVEDAQSLRKFLSGESEWILRMMRWREDR